jgi:hypothetical protein
VRIPPLEVTIDRLRIPGPNRTSGEHWAARHKRRNNIHAVVDWEILAAGFARWRGVIGGMLPEAPRYYTIHLTRRGAGTMDPDNLAASLKHVQDAVAMRLGLDDGSMYADWRYAQEKTPRGVYGVRICIEPAGVRNVSSTAEE